MFDVHNKKKPEKLNSLHQAKLVSGIFSMATSLVFNLSEKPNILSHFKVCLSWFLLFLVAERTNKIYEKNLREQIRYMRKFERTNQK